MTKGKPGHFEGKEPIKDRLKLVKPDGVPTTALDWDPDGNWKSKEGVWSDGGSDTHNGVTRKFRKGNIGGVGQPMGTKVNLLRKAFYEEITPDKLKAIIKKAVMMALAGNERMIITILDRALGPVNAIDLIERQEKLGELIEKLLATRTDKAEKDLTEFCMRELKLAQQDAA